MEIMMIFVRRKVVNLFDHYHKCYNSYYCIIYCIDDPGIQLNSVILVWSVYHKGAFHFHYIFEYDATLNLFQYKLLHITFPKFQSTSIIFC